MIIQKNANRFRYQNNLFFYSFKSVSKYSQKMIQKKNRVLVIISKKNIKTATKRNYIRRRIKSAIHTELKYILNDFLVIWPKNTILNCEWKDICDSIIHINNYLEKKISI